MTFATPRPSSLPPELIHEIAGWLPVNDLISFCLVCHDVHSICTGILYRNIHTVKAQCFDTLVSNSQKAQAVRKLTLPAQINVEFETVCTWLEPVASEALLHHEPTSTDIKASTILPLLPNLQNLSVPPFSAIYTPVLSECHFPHLRTFSYAMPITQPILLFLSRISTLVKLSLDCYLPFRSDSQIQDTRITLPNLQELSGNPQIVKIFAENAPLSRVSINWNFDRRNMDVLDQALECLAKYCSDTLKELVVYRSLFNQTTDNAPILFNVSSKLPSITRLGLNGVQLDPAIYTTLSQIKHLDFLNMDYYPPGAIRPPRCRSPNINHDQDEIVISSFSSACPTLRNCRLPSTSCPPIHNNLSRLKNYTDGVLWYLHAPGGWLPSLADAPRRKSLLSSISNWRSRRLGSSA
ncbi:hypothetical protein D9757_000947 [Collybiopsis confluens]|uniref:F-box domain-containing protein n=1 Tax=Collybiopsis confluens TaxID=2823264 RepID=A0A8H5MFL2_9AGAR|nr:hypothetical protein D9757_000947 [Collybiopsis confluens]